MNEQEIAYWKKRDQIVDADKVWLAQNHVVDAVTALRERGYEMDSHEVKTLQDCVNRLANLAVRIANGDPEETDAEHQAEVTANRYAGAG